MKPLTRFLPLIVIAGLAACGGGGGDDNSSSGITVDAGSDITVNEGDSVSLTGRARGDSGYTFSWTSSDSSISITHSDTSKADASFIAPEVRTTSQIVTFTLSASGANGSSASDSILVTMDPVNELPVATIVVEQDSRFPTNTFQGDETVTLDGSTSTDFDPIDITTTISSYLWEQTAGTNATLESTLTSSSLEFKTPIIEEQETLTFSLTVTDNEDATSTTSVDITVLRADDALPEVDAGEDITIVEGEYLLLNGEVESISQNAQPFTIQWRNLSSTSMTINDSTATETYAVAPEVSSSTEIVLQLDATDQFNNSVSETVTVTVIPATVTSLNDTGMLASISETTGFNIPVNEFPGQDGDVGRDRISSNIDIEKAGNGLGGFDFTKLDELGDEIDDESSQWSCIRDNITGFVWEVKTDDDGLHDKDYDYTWYSTDTATNGGSDGTQASADANCSIANCNTEAFVAAVNAEGMCGFFDWRLPTHMELQSIANYGTASGIFVDVDYFPNAVSNSQISTWYWTGAPNVDGAQDEVAVSAWAIDFTTGNDNFLSKSTPSFVRLVRAGR